MKEHVADVIEEGLSCLQEHLGIMKTEMFIAVIQREAFDYTKWHQTFVDSISDAEFDRLCEKSAQEHPFAGQPGAIL